MKQQFIPLTILALLFLFLSACNTQNKPQENQEKNDIVNLEQIYSADGKALGYRSELKLGLIEGSTSIFQVPMSPDHSGFCDCMLDQVLPEITKEQYDEIIRTKHFDPSLTPEFMACFQKFSEGLSKDYAPHESMSKERSLQTCIEAATNAAAGQATKEQIEDYCICVTDKIFSLGYSMTEIMKADDETSDVYKNAILPCQQQVFR